MTAALSERALSIGADPGDTADERFRKRLLVGVYAGFLLGSVGWIPLRLLGITRDRNFPFGPFMLLGAVVGIVWGADIGGYLADRQA